MSSLIARIKSLPRSMRWLLTGGVLCLLYFFVVEPVIVYVNSVNMDSDKIAVVLERADVERKAREGSDKIISTGKAKFGHVEFPGDPEARPVEFNRQISEVISRNGLKEDSTLRTATLGAGPLAGVIGTDKRIQRNIKELTITATPEQVIKLISDLERLPTVTTISRVQIRKPGENEQAGRKVKADISVETWTIERKGKAR